MNDYPEELMPALEEVRYSGDCNMFDLYCVVDRMRDRERSEVADWLVENRRHYFTLLRQDFSAWLERNPSPRGESLAQRVARETGLELIEDRS